MLTGFQNRSPPRRNVDQHPPTCPKVGFSSLGRPSVGGQGKERRLSLPIDLAARRGERQRTATLSEKGICCWQADSGRRTTSDRGDYMDCVRVTDPDAIPATHHHERHSTVPGNHRVTGRRTRTAADRFRDRSGTHPEADQRWLVAKKGEWFPLTLARASGVSRERRPDQRRWLKVRTPG